MHGPTIMCARIGDRDRVKARPTEGKGDEPMKKFISVTTSFTLTAAAAGQCWALGLGELSLYSHLNEPFSAEIALLEAEGLSEGEMQVGLAPMPSSPGLE